MKKIFLIVLGIYAISGYAQDPCTTTASRFAKIKLTCLATSSNVSNNVLTLNGSGEFEIITKAAYMAGVGGAVTSVNSQTGAVFLTSDNIGDGTTFKQYSLVEKNKLAGIASGATANSTDAFLLSFANHTNLPTTISGYGITDFNSLGDARWSLTSHNHTFASLTSKPTTLSGYGITDAYPLTGNPSAFITSSALTPYLTSSTASSTYQPIGSYLTSYTETDPIVKAINGIVKSNGTTINSAVANTDYALPNAVNTNYANDYRLANFVAGTDYLAPNGSASGLTGFPTLNQNTTGTASNVTGIVAVANGGTGTATPSLVAGSNITITGTFPNQTINSSGGIASGEANTASNVNTSGVGVFKQKTLLNLEFKGIDAGSNKVTVANDAVNNTVDIDVTEANLVIPQTSVIGLVASLTDKMNLTTPQTKNVGVTANTTPLKVTGSINDFLEITTQNTSTGTGAQSGFTALADNGTTTTNFTWLGKNNSTFANPQTYNVGGAEDGTILNDGGNLWIHNTGTTGKIAFSTGNVSTPFYTERMAINSNGSIGFNGSVGTAGQVLTSNGASSPTWVTPNSQTVIKDVTASSSNTGVTTETLLKTITIPAGSFTANDLMQILLSTEKTGTAGAYTTRIKVNTVNTFATATLIATYTTTGITFIDANIERKNLVFTGGNLRGSSATTSVITDITPNANAKFNIALNPANVFYIFVSTQNVSTADSTIIRSVKINN